MSEPDPKTVKEVSVEEDHSLGEEQKKDDELQQNQQNEPEDTPMAVAEADSEQELEVEDNPKDDGDSYEENEEEVEPSSSIDPEELQDAIAAAVDAATNNEESDSVILDEASSHLEEDDEDEVDDIRYHRRQFGSELYMEESSVELPLDAAARKFSVTSTRSSGFDFEEACFEAVQEERDGFVGDTNGNGPRIKNLETKKTENGSSNNRNLSPISTPTRQRTASKNQVAAEEADTLAEKSLPELLESCRASPRLSLEQLRNLSDEDVPEALRLVYRNEPHSPRRLAIPTETRAHVEEEVLLLHAIFASFCTPAPSTESVSRIFKLERETSWDLGHWKQRTTQASLSPSESIPLPTDALISVAGQEKMSVVQILCTPRVFLELPMTFSLAFCRILVRLLTNETDLEYDEESWRTLSWWDSQTEEDDQVSDTDTDEEDLQKQTHERVYRLRRRKEVLEAMRKQRQTDLTQAMNMRMKQRPHHVYTVVRFLSGTAWENSSSPVSALWTLFETLRTSSPRGDFLLPPVARLLGISCCAGVSVKELRCMLKLASQPLPDSKSLTVTARELRFPALDRLLVVQALCRAAEGASRAHGLVGKVNPQRFFSFGRGKGMTRDIERLSAWPFKNDFGMAVWFRAETFDYVTSGQYPKLLNIRTPDGGGIEVALMPLDSESIRTGTSTTVITVTVFDSGGKSDEKSSQQTHQVKMKGCVLHPRMWYHVAVRHTRSRLQGVFSLASRQQLSILLNGKVVLTEPMPFPKLESSDFSSDKSTFLKGLRRQSEKVPPIASINIQFGSDFEGQAGSLFIFKDNVSDATLKALCNITARMHGATRKEEREDASWDSRRADKALKSSALAVQITKVDAEEIVLSSQDAHCGNTSSRPLSSSEKIAAAVADMGEADNQEVAELPQELLKASFGSKLFLVWDPSRAESLATLDLHAGAHVGMDADVAVAWNIEGASDVVGSIGGVQALLPVFQTLLSGDLERWWSLSKKDSSFDDRAMTFHIIPILFYFISSFLRGHDGNAREMLRCGGIDIIEQLLLANKKISESCKETAASVLTVYPGLSRMIVDALLNLRSACAHYTGLETTVYSRILFNLPVWFGNMNGSHGVALHAALLPVLSKITRIGPGKARDCVGVKQLVQSLIMYTTASEENEDIGAVSKEPATELFDRGPFSGLGKRAPLTLNERRHVIDILFGMITESLMAGVSPLHLSPLLNYLSYNLYNEWEKAVDDVKSGQAPDVRTGSRLEIHQCTVKAASILYLLLQTRPVVEGLFDSIEKCCEGTHHAASWILCALVNSFDDTLRSIGIRCLSAYLDIVAPTSEAVLFSGSWILNNPVMPEDDIANSLTQTRIPAAKRLTTTISNVGKGLVAMGNNTVLANIMPTSRVSVKVVYKLLWHLLKAHRLRLGQKTHSALIELLLDSTGFFRTADAVVEAVISDDDILYSGCRFNDDRALTLIEEENSLADRNVLENGSMNTILRLLRFLDDEMKQRWLFDLVHIVSSSQSNIAVLLKSPQWQPSLFHLESDVVEQLKVSLAENAAAADSDGKRNDTTSKEDKEEGHPTTSASVAERLFDLSIKLYATLLGHSFRCGGDEALRAIEQAASLQRVCVNGPEVFNLVLNHFLADLIEHGTLDLSSTSVHSAADDIDEHNRLLKRSARKVTTAIVSSGGGDIDVGSAVNQWRCLRHLTAVVAASVTKSGFGVVQLLDYRNKPSSAIDSASGGLHGIRLPDGNVSGISGTEYVRILELTPPTPPNERTRREDDLDKRISVTLASQVLSLLDAFIFPDSLDASHPASQLHGLTLVRSNEPRLGVSQGPLLASLIRLSLILLCYLEPSSVKFLQCCSRLRCFLYWTIELIRESVSLAGYSAAFHDLTAPLDRLVLATILQCHRSLARCAAVLLELEGSAAGKYFLDEAAKKKNLRRLLRVAFELREIVLAGYRGRNEVLRVALSAEAFGSLQTSLELVNKSGSKEMVIRAFLKSEWVSGYHDVDLDGEYPVPELVADGQIRQEEKSSKEGRDAIGALHAETKAIISDFNHALDESFDAYCEDQRRWAETDAVRELEDEGDTAVRRLSGRWSSDLSDTLRIQNVRALTSKNRWKSVDRKVLEIWTNAVHWKLAKHTDRLNRRILLAQNRHFKNHEEASYELMLAQERDKANRDREERARKKIQEELAEVMRRNTSAFVQSTGHDVDEDDIDEDLLDSVGEEVNGNTDPGVSIDGTAVQDEAESDLVDSENDSKKLQTEEVHKKSELANDDKWAKAFIWSDTESVVARFNTVSIVALQTITSGKLILTSHGLYFHQTGDIISVMTKNPVEKRPEDEEKSLRWRLSRLTEVHGRRFMLRAQALELFFSDSHELFLNFAGGRERDRFYAKLRNSCNVPLLWSPKSLNPRVVFKKSQLTSLWRRRKISNFQYLMLINKIAGRTFNDLTQYPVFPWVLADYTSDSLDLTDSRTFRDLSKPVGALNPDRLAQLIERYNDLESFGFAEHEKFLYGSHYSSPGMVLHFMLRQEPFTTMAIELQSGRFDCPDRLFFDVAGCWRSCLTSTSDVKELIPEFFTCPEMFLNTNNFPFGKTQDNRLVGNVALPPWAKGSAYEFVRIHRLALESEYVSQHLGQWIDLIFGFKQRGPEAEAAHNLFHYLSYEGSVDLDKITDEVDRKATESHIQNFGQTPTQLLTKDPHPARFSAANSWKPLMNDVSVPKHLKCHTPGNQFGGGRGEARGAICCIHVLTETVLLVYADLTIGSYKWNPQRIRIPGSGRPFSIRMDKHRPLVRRELSTSRAAIKRGSAAPPSMDDAKNSRSVGNWSFGFTLGGSVQESLRRKAAIAPNRLTAVSAKDSFSTAETSSLLVSCGYWDNTVKVHSIDGSKLLCCADGGHRGPIRCLALGDDGGLLVTGGEDATCRVWVVDHPDMAIALSDGYVQTALGGSHDRDQLLSCCHVLWGHETPISCLALSSDLDVAVSGSLGGRICVHTLRRGKFIRSLHPAENQAIRKLAIETHGSFVAHTEDGGLHVYTINGVRLASANAGELLSDLKICGDNLLVTGGESGFVLIRTLSDLKIQSRLDLRRHGPIRCLSLTPEELNPLPQYLFIGSDNGMLTIVDKDQPSERNDKDLAEQTVIFDSIEEF